MKLKKIIISITLFMLFSANIAFVFADDIDTDTDAGDINAEVLEAISKSANEPQINSRSAVIFDRD